MIEKIHPSNLPQSKGHYSPGVVLNGLVYVSGQLPEFAVEATKLLGLKLEGSVG